MEQQYKTDSEIYAVLEREIIDLTLRPGCSLSENPLCTRFGAPRSLIRVVLQRFKSKADFFPSLPVALKAVGLPEVIQGQTKVILITAVACLALLVISLVLPKKLPRFLNR